MSTLPKIEVVPVETFRPQTTNANAHTARGHGALTTSIQADGWIGAQTAAADGEIFDGSDRQEAAVATGFATTLVIDSDGSRPIIIRRTDIPTATDPRAVRLGLAANRIAQLNLAWDPTVLTALDPERLVGLWTPEELTTALGPGTPLDEEAERIARAAQLQDKWGTAEGQLWEISGRTGQTHWVLCGDTVAPETNARLLALAPPDIVLTDPPYELPGAEVMAAVARYADRAVIMSAGPQAFALAGGGWRYCMDLVWRHRVPRSFPTTAQPVHYHVNLVGLVYGDPPVVATPEPFTDLDTLNDTWHTYLLCLTRDRAKLGWHRPGTRFGSVIEIAGAEYEDGAHGHGKSAEVFRQVVRGFRWQTWCDPYIGSGATLLACDAESRSLLGCERDPALLACLLERVTGAGLQCRWAA